MTLPLWDETVEPQRTRPDLHPLFLLGDMDWIGEGRCAHIYHPDAWFDLPERYDAAKDRHDSHPTMHTQLALDRAERELQPLRDECDRCPVNTECLLHAMEHEKWGLWGKTTPEERRQLRVKFK